MSEAGGVLTRIAMHTETRVRRFKEQTPVEALREGFLYKREPQAFSAAFCGPQPRVIAEVKFASPSQGFLTQRKPSTEEALRVAGSYLSNGAAALSILTERHFFAGAPDHLAGVRFRHPKALILMKDFFIDPYQLELARACGADCILLIAALLGEKLGEFHAAAKALGLSALVEVHTEAQLRAAQAVEAELIGVNSRDLKTLKTDLGVARALGPMAPGSLLIAESGISTRQDLDELTACGYRGFLVGTTLMKTQDPGQALADLLRA
ncbi:MAG: indole-3-glycerol phosphate synthase TrpC [Elusimicrobiota bacterium]